MKFGPIEPLIIYLPDEEDSHAWIFEFGSFWAGVAKFLNELM